MQVLPRAYWTPGIATKSQGVQACELPHKARRKNPGDLSKSLDNSLANEHKYLNSAEDKQQC